MCETFPPPLELSITWEVEVEDTGSGMSREIQARAMEPFFTTKPQGKGTGLGLSLVYGTVKAHQGQVELQSEPGRGTRVSLRFPPCRPSAPDPGPPGASQSAQPRRALHLLLVDDDELIQCSVPEMLGALGHRTVVAAGGAAALAELQGGLRPDGVILDMNMPGMDGALTLARIRALLPEVPVLLATGRVDQAAMDLIASDPRVTLLAKPFSLDLLRRQLERHFPQ